MSEKERIENLNIGIPKKWKAPIDVKIVAWFLIFFGILGLLSSILLMTGIAYSRPDTPRKVFFGLIILVSDEYSGIYYLMFGSLNFFTGYIIKKGKKPGWYFAFFGSIIGISDAILLGLSVHKISGTIGIFMELVLIIWLIYRRKLYNIGTKSEIKS